MPTLRERVSAFFAGQVPTRRVTIYNERYTPQFSSQALDVDRVHSIIEGANDGDPRQLFALYEDLVFDTHIQAEFAKRKLAVLGDTLTIQPFDKKNAEDVKAAEAISALVEEHEGWLTACIVLLDRALWPVSVIEKVFRPATQPGLRYELAELVHVSPQLLDYTTGALRIWETDPATGAILGGFIEPDPSRYIVHRAHLLTAPDYRGGPMRSLVMWWLLSTLDRDWWARFLSDSAIPAKIPIRTSCNTKTRFTCARSFCE